MKALIVVNVQNDFCPGGSLAVKDGDKIVPVINSMISQFDLVIFTKDWHPAGMKAFASSYKSKKPFDKYKVNGEEDTLWPDHCVQNTQGAELHKDIDFAKIPKDFYIFKKGTTKSHHPYSGFDGTELAEFLEERKVETVFICGLALDYCCVETAIDSSFLGFDTTLILDATKSINPDISDTLIKLYEANVKIKESWELNLKF